MRKWILSIMVFAPLWMPGADAFTLFDTANARYEQQDFEGAISAYLQLVDEGYRGAELFYNLGNAYYKTKAIGPSILYFEKALKFNPDDEDIQHNLGMANLQIVDKVDAVQKSAVSKQWDALLNSLSLSGWAWLTVTLIWLSGFLAITFLISKRNTIKKILFVGAIVFLTGWLLSLYLAGQKYSLDHKGKFGIVLATNSYIKSEPSGNSTDLFILHEGVKVKIIEEKNGWLNIRFDENRVGWIPADDLEMI